MIDYPTFSVIIDAFNYGAYIEDAIKSVLTQTLDKSLYEIIVIDDGSTDDTRIRVEKYLPDVIYHYKKNGGQASAFNAGVAIARGEFIAFLDADDFWKENKLKEVLEKFRSDSEIGVIYHTLAIVNKTGKYIETFPKWFNRIKSDIPAQNYEDWLTVIGSSTSGISFRASVLKKLMPIPNDYKLCADGYLMICAPLITKKFGLLDSELGYYRIHGENGFASVTTDGKSFQVKSEQLCSYYNSLFSKHLAALIEKHGFSDTVLPAAFKAQCFQNAVFETKHREGRMKAILRAWQDRSALTTLPLKYRLFRTAGILTRLLLSEKAYFYLRKVYAETFLWRLVNCRS